MRIDYTEPLHELRGDLRVRVGALLGTWVVLVGAVSVAVQRTAKRSARRLEAEIADAAVAAESSTPPLGLPLDPVTAEVHRTLRDVLRRQRAREQDVARQLAHADQLAGLGRLAASLAHEIKNPLAGIQGALELLCDETAEGDQKRLYGEMLNELGRVNGILHRLLESGRPAPLRVVRSDLGALIGDTIALLQPSLRRQRVELASEVAEGLSAVELDPAKIRQVLVNLIQNAAEAIGERGGSIRVRASVYRDAAAAVVTVEDDGPGIPADVLPRLFEPFYTTKFTGTGLGLAISKSLVEQHGGSLEAASEPGRGASFVLVLPLAREAALPAEGS
jgi:signal transduction histidine kinase